MPARVGFSSTTNETVPRSPVNFCFSRWTGTCCLRPSISFSLKKLQARARDAEEREGLRRYALISGTVASIAVLGMCFGTVFEWPYPVFMLLWGGYVATWDVLVLVYLPRVTARRLALERAEDPTAEARQRRDRRKVIAMVTCATLCTLVNLGLTVYAMWRR